MKQLELVKRVRETRGRKRGHNTPHVKREKQTRHDPIHVTLRCGVDGLREQFAVIREAISAAKERFGVLINHFSVMHDHIHLIVEAESAEALGAAMKGLEVRIAKALNNALQRKGPVFTDRYFAVRLRNPTQVRFALRYVLLNGAKHDVRRNTLDTCTSGQYFDGWKDYTPDPTEPSPVSPPRSKLQRDLWKRHGLISIKEIPGGKRQRR
jgi:putative transposase